MLPNPQPCFARLVDPRRETRNKLHARRTSWWSHSAPPCAAMMA